MELDVMVVDNEKSKLNSKENNEDPIDKMDEENIQLSAKEMMRIYQPWSYSLIIKLLRKKMMHTYLKSRLTTLWKTSEDILLIDLGHDYFTVKFLKEENMNKVLHNSHGSLIDSFSLLNAGW
ncbi:hypothetical protein R3W88_007733 [Solanum pinnatisectum]|uniref:DUF4283 domain-containing protein n=1 Tax=Solanum pinnatisectum TaxID=50273 RepID=A0AAV9M7W9_9SOLN|nr:hypothetical protein R3W88_007733 [Solanum pinnatisectum]